MHRTSARSVLSLSVLALLFTGSLLYAGPLNPPAGPVASTGKTLAEVEPRIAINLTNTPGDADSLFKIVAPGSYYLTGNITGVVGKHGIEIVASGVTLDLNGFDLVGVPSMGLFDGVSVTVAGLRNITVQNGSIRKWGDDGIDLFSQAAAGCRVEAIDTSGNGDNGLVIGINSTVTNCSAHANASHGIFTGEGCTITNCTAVGHALFGIFAGNGSTLSNCSSNSNTGTGIGTGSGCTVSICSAFQNTGNGISTSTGCMVSNCSAAQNTGNGIVVIGGTVMTCSAYSNDGSGISTSTGCTVSNCSGISNSVSGISVSSGSTVADCVARLNTLDGIVCSYACVVRGNSCTGNGNSVGDGAGIHATSFSNRIEGNTCSDADRGIDVDAIGNIIIKNTCSGNGLNWAIAAGNICLVVQGVNSGAIVGSTGGVAPGSTDPNANFSY